MLKLASTHLMQTIDIIDTTATPPTQSSLQWVDQSNKPLPHDTLVEKTVIKDQVKCMDYL